MSSFLEELWETYQAEHPNRNDGEEDELVKELYAHEEALLKQLNSAGAEHLQAMEALLNTVGFQNEKKAFAAGVRFAVKFLYDAVSK